MADSNEIIAVHGLVKRFGDFTAVDGISFSVKEGEIFDFLGPNGAGKTTTIKILITLMRPTRGTASVGGHDVVREAEQVRRIIGYVSQLISVDGSLTAYENLSLMARLYDIPRKEREARIKNMLAFLELEDHARCLVRTFSGGMIRKLEVGQAMIHNPRVLFLDEPTIGLDPVAKESVWDRLAELRDRFGTAIFFSTHNMEEAAEVCDRVVILNEGKIAALGTVKELTEKTGQPGATLEDAFIHFTGNSLHETGDYREVRRTRRTQRRRG